MFTAVIWRLSIYIHTFTHLLIFKKKKLTLNLKTVRSLLTQKQFKKLYTKREKKNV